MDLSLYIIKNILSPLFYKIITVSICATIIGIIILIVKNLLNKKISCKINQIIWIIFLISLLISPKIENKFSIYNFINIDKIEELSININFNSLETYDGLERDENYEFNDFKVNINKQIDKLETKEIISLIYFGIILLKILKNIILVITYIKTDKEILDKNSKEYKLVEKIKNKLQIKKDIILIKSKFVNSPMIGGLFIPKIFISDKKINEIDLECMLTHELCHYKRKDNIINIFINFFKSIHFFNPIILWCLNRIEKDIELATDEKTLKTLDENMKNRYCTLLVIMSNKENINKYNLGFAKYKSFIEERINTIINKKKFIPKTKYIVILIIICICILFFCFTKEKNHTNYNQLKYLTIKINNIEYKIESYNSDKEYEIIKCIPEEVITIPGNKELFCLTLNKKDLDSGRENSSTFFFNNNDIKIYLEPCIGKSLYELKVKYENKEEIKYCFIIEIE